MVINIYTKSNCITKMLVKNPIIELLGVVIERITEREQA